MIDRLNLFKNNKKFHKSVYNNLLLLVLYDDQYLNNDLSCFNLFYFKVVDGLRTTFI